MLFTEPFMQARVILAYFLLPSFAVAVMVTFLPPAFLLKVTIPVELTVAILVLLDFQVTALFVALEGVIVAAFYILLYTGSQAGHTCVIFF